MENFNNSMTAHITNGYGRVDPTKPEDFVIKLAYPSSFLCEVIGALNPFTITVIPLMETKVNELQLIDEFVFKKLYLTFHRVVKVWVRCYVKSITVENAGMKYHVYLPDYNEYLTVPTSEVREIPTDFRLEKQFPINIALNNFRFHSYHHKNVMNELNLFRGKIIKAQVTGIDVFGHLIATIFSYEKQVLIFDYICKQIMLHRSMYAQSHPVNLAPLFAREQSIVSIKLTDAEVAAGRLNR